MVNILSRYASNTHAGTSNNFMLFGRQDESKRSRIFYKVNCHSELPYRFLFSNTVDSTFGDGSKSQGNTPGGRWKLHAAFAGDGGAYGVFPDALPLQPLTFDGASEKEFLPGEAAATDEICLSIPENHYLCVELVFSGENIPYTPDKIIPAFSLSDDGVWQPDKDFPQPVFVGCDRPVKKKLAFIGDSITQGLGTTEDAYAYWVAETARRLGDAYAVCNLGLGYARAKDAAADGVWLARAKAFDVVFVCLGVNDLSRYPTDEICRNLRKICILLREAGCKVGLLSTPPFDMKDDLAAAWYAICDYEERVLAAETDFFFRTDTVLGQVPPNAHLSRYGGHPDDNGGKALGSVLADKILPFLAGLDKTSGIH